MRIAERALLWSALGALAAALVLRAPAPVAVATAPAMPSDLGPADAVILTGKDSNLQLRNADGKLAFGDQPTARAWSVGAVNSDKVMKLLLKSERFEDERKQLEEGAKGKDEEFRKRYAELESKYKDLDPKSPGFEQGRGEVEAFFKEVEGWRKEITDRLGRLQAEQIEKAYREMANAVDVVADRAKVDLVFRFVPTSQEFGTQTPADAMLAVQVRTFLRYPEAVDLTAELLKELSLKDD
jgi:Skp family chaperone for outer membrane proteins